MLYCVKHSQMVKAYHGVTHGLFHLHTIEVNNSQDPGERFDVQECDFDDGWATVPPPLFDMDEFMETAEQEYSSEDESLVEADKASGYDYNPLTDQLIQWEVAS